MKKRQRLFPIYHESNNRTAERNVAICPKSHAFLLFLGMKSDKNVEGGGRQLDNSCRGSGSAVSEPFPPDHMVPVFGHEVEGI